MKKRIIISIIAASLCAFNINSVCLAKEPNEETEETHAEIDSKITNEFLEFETEKIVSNDESLSGETRQLEKEVVIKNKEYFYDINITYSKEVYENPITMTGVTSVNLDCSFEIPEHGQLDEKLISDDSDVTKIVDAIDFPETLQNGYNIIASINLDGQVSIESIKETNAIEKETEVVIYEEVEEDDAEEIEDEDLAEDNAENQIIEDENFKSGDASEVHDVESIDTKDDTFSTDKEYNSSEELSEDKYKTNEKNKTEIAVNSDSDSLNSNNKSEETLDIKSENPSEENID